MDITITELCSHSNIARQTFYRHFSDKYEILNWHFAKISTPLREVGRSMTWHEAHVLLFTEICKARSVYTARITSYEFYGIDETAKRLTRDMYIETLTQYKKIVLTPLLRFQCEAAAACNTTISAMWARGGMKETPQELSHMLDTVLPPLLKSVLEEGL